MHAGLIEANGRSSICHVTTVSSGVGWWRLRKRLENSDYGNCDSNRSIIAPLVERLVVDAFVCHSRIVEPHAASARGGYKPLRGYPALTRRLRLDRAWRDLCGDRPVVHFTPCWIAEDFTWTRPRRPVWVTWFHRLGSVVWPQYSSVRCAADVCLVGHGCSRRRERWNPFGWVYFIESLRVRVVAPDRRSGAGPVGAAGAGLAVLLIATTTALDWFAARRPWSLVDRLRFICRDQGLAHEPGRMTRRSPLDSVGWYGA